MYKRRIKSKLEYIEKDKIQEVLKRSFPTTGRTISHENCYRDPKIQFLEI